MNKTNESQIDGPLNIEDDLVPVCMEKDEAPEMM